MASRFSTSGKPWRKRVSDSPYTDWPLHRSRCRQATTSDTWRGGGHIETQSFALNAFALPEFGEKELAKLTYDELVKWHRHLATLPARLRSGSKPQKFRHTENDPERLRVRRVSANRILAQFRAALNLAFKHGKVPSDSHGGA